MLNLVITRDDIERSERLQVQERIDTTSKDLMFSSLVYVLLSAKEKYTRQMVMYERLRGNGMISPQTILDTDISSIVKGLRKDEYLKELAVWWPESRIYERINDDIISARKDEFNIRNDIAENAHGILYKCASLFMNMCGYRNVVTLDKWALRALVSEDYDIKSYYHKDLNRSRSHNYLGTNSHGDIYMDRGVTDRRSYLLYESYFADMVRKYNQRFGLDLDAFDFKQILWAKKSSWGEKFGNDPNQMIIDF